MVNEREPLSSTASSAVPRAASRSTKQDLQEHTKAAAAEVRERVGEATEKLRRRAAETAESQRETIADMTNDLGAAIRKAGEELHDRGDERTGEWADALAEQLERAGRYLRERELRDLFREVQSFAKRRPGLVVGGLFAAGIAASRFLKADRDEAEFDAADEFDADEPFDDFSSGFEERSEIAPAPGSSRPNVIPAQPRGNEPGSSPREEGKLP